MIRTISFVPVDKIVFKPEYTVLCSVGKKPFYGTVEIVMQPIHKNKPDLLELESFEAWLKGLSNQEYTIESLAVEIMACLLEVLGKKNFYIDVIVYAKTLVHSPVECHISSKGLSQDK